MSVVALEDTGKDEPQKPKRTETFEYKVRRRRQVRLEARIILTLDSIVDAAARGKRQCRGPLQYESKDDALCVCEQVIRRARGGGVTGVIRKNANTVLCGGTYYTLQFKWDKAPFIKE